MDSIKTQYSQVLLVDNGGFFPEDDLHQDAAWFLTDAMKMLGTDAVGVGDAELRFGLAYLKGLQKRSQLPFLSANLVDSKTRLPVLSTSVVKTVGTVKVGIFGLISDKVNLGPARDSLAVLDPAATAKKTIAELRKKGATVVVLLSQLGKVESEDLATAVDGIDVVICGRNVPLVQKGRMIKNTMAVYGGEQGQYMGRTIVSLDAAKKPTSSDCETFILGPEVGEKAELAALVKGFEDNLNAKLAKAEKERAAQQQAKQGSSSPDHFVGAEVCMRCHVQEAEQWKSTKHSHAWQTLVDRKKDSTPECITCHVVGYKQPGGFASGVETPTLSNVQCENCHGMGTGHEAFASSPKKIGEATCRGCHTVSTSPTFDYATYLPHILHKYQGTPPAIAPHTSPMDAK